MKTNDKFHLKQINSFLHMVVWSRCVVYVSLIPLFNWVIIIQATWSDVVENSLFFIKIMFIFNYDFKPFFQIFLRLSKICEHFNLWLFITDRNPLHFNSCNANGEPGTRVSF